MSMHRLPFASQPPVGVTSNTLTKTDHPMPAHQGIADAGSGRKIAAAPASTTADFKKVRIAPSVGYEDKTTEPALVLVGCHIIVL